MLTDLDKIEAVRAAMPAEGLFAEKEWLISPSAFPLGEKFAEELEKLGHRLSLFNRACNLLYRLSVQGKQPRWVADYLDRGKPPELVEFSRARIFRDDLPRVIRPDLVLTDEGFTIAELDSVPGGIGLTAWLSRTYAALGEDILAGADGMIEGFRSILLGGAEIMVSEEAATYAPEMRWLCAQLGDGYRVTDTAPREHFDKNVYRFFELFDLPNVGCAKMLMDKALAGDVTVTPPFKPFLEEKMWFALFWLRPLRDFWIRELSARHFEKLQRVIPYTWMLDPAPLPQHAVIPKLEVNDWRELAGFSQKQRELILKISGFSELAWGSRSVSLAADMPHKDWAAALDHALAEFESHPYILQRFHKGRLFGHPYFDRAAGRLRTLQGRVRLCPYYFLADGKATLRGALATICPADKKLLHGMRDAILVPARNAG